jgi:GT2 family glycosyltransferase
VKTSIIIPCYWVNVHLIRLTEDCLTSLKAYGSPDEVIVVDDGSPITVGANVVRETNGGFAAAVNSGLREASGDVLIVSNNDIVFTPCWLNAILSPLDAGYDISSIRTSDCDGYTVEDKITENDNFGSLWAMKRNVYETLGGLDERFGKGTFEDQDYKQRALAAGFRIAKNHAGLVEHVGRATFDTVDPGHESFSRNQKVYKEKWGRVD